MSKHPKRTLLAWLLTFAILLSLLPTIVWAADTYDEYGFYTDSSGVIQYEPAVQNSDGVYEIASAGNLFWFAALVNGDTNQSGVTAAVSDADAVLLRDIDLNPGYTFDATGRAVADDPVYVTAQTWTPIGSYDTDEETNVYSGTFDGDGYSVSGVCINQNFVGIDDFRYGYIGLFGYVQGGSITDLTLTNSYISGTAWNGSVTAGGVVGHMEEGSISGCANSGAVFSAGVAAYSGGIAGYVSDAAVSDCVNSGSVSASGQSSYYASAYVGGIVGEMSCSALSGCANSGEITTGSTSSVSIGGIAGYGIYSALGECENSGEISASAPYVDAAGIVGYCYDTTVSVCDNTGGVVSEDVILAYTGGIAGWAWGDSAVSDCENSGDVTVTASDSSTLYICAGGTVGRSHCESSLSTISRCVNSGDVTVTAAVVDDDDVWVGGITGFVSNIPVSACANTGDVIIFNKNSADDDSNWEASAGGIAGYIDGKSISSCYSAGTIAVSGGPASYVGGIAGNLSAAAVEDCYYLTGMADCGVGTDSETASDAEKTAAEFASGAVCYLLNGERVQNVTWYQTVGSDAYPVLDSAHGVVHLESDGSYKTYAAEINSTSISFNVTYGQTEARTMLEMINDFRTGDDAWAWDSSDSTQVSYSGLGELTYSYELEAAAMQRAAEIALNFSHTRTDGISCFTVGYSYGENIAVGYPSAEAVFVGWQETDEDYSGQGHRRNMLGSYTAVGIGHVVYNGVHYWVQEFGYVSEEADPGANDSETAVSVEVDTELLTSLSVSPAVSSLTFSPDSSIEVPDVSVTLQFTSAWPAMASTVSADQVVWTVEDTDIVSLTDGVLTGLQLGTTTLSALVLGQTVSVEVSVAHTYGDPVFTWSEDYSACTARFDCIDTDCEESQTVACDIATTVTAPTCTENGQTAHIASVTFLDSTYTNIITEAIPATDHTAGSAVKENVVEATATTDGSYDSVVYCTVCGGEISREAITVPATGDTGTDDTSIGNTDTGDSGTAHTHSYTGAVT
ncbi:MAG: CAP domain-containing protein, partial [Oscillospiraceae bacterium]|nr:CAP domain-containing protein [Oscillospiraceae bacterium]